MHGIFTGVEDREGNCAYGFVASYEGMGYRYARVSNDENGKYIHSESRFEQDVEVYRFLERLATRADSGDSRDSIDKFETVDNLWL